MVCHIIRVIVCLALCALCQCAPAKDPTCLCYVDFYNCDISCVSQYKTEQNVRNMCMGMCVRNYANCRARCNGEQIQISMPSQVKLPPQIDALF